MKLYNSYCPAIGILCVLLVSAYHKTVLEAVLLSLHAIYKFLKVTLMGVPRDFSAF